MSRRPKYDPASYEPCPVGCGKQRWRGEDFPVCKWCQRHLMDFEWCSLRSRLKGDNASLDVLNPFDQALVADCKETFVQVGTANALRRRAKIQ